MKFKDARGKITEKRSKVCPPPGSKKKKKDSCCDSDCGSGVCTILEYSKERRGQWWWEGKFTIRGKPLTEGEVVLPPKKIGTSTTSLLKEMEVYACAGGPGRTRVSGQE